MLVYFYSGEDINECLDSLESQNVDVEVIVVNNGLRDQWLAQCQCRFPLVSLISLPGNAGFAGGAQAGANTARTDVLLFMNPDVQLMPGCLDALIGALNEGGDVVGPTLLVGQEKTLEYGGTIDLLGMPSALNEPGDPLFVSGCCLGVRKQVYAAVGGFDVRYFMFMEDIEMCWRAIRGGYNIQCVSTAFAIHGGGGSTPGGYMRSGRLETSRLRLVYRERNTVATLLSCCPWWVLPLSLTGSVLRSLGVFAYLASKRDYIGAWRCLMGLIWNAREIPGTLRRRRALATTRGGRRRAWQRIRHGITIFGLLRKNGLPVLVE
ncbi:MAG: glycosyltransferase [Actinomycetes bacterium]